MVMRICRKCGVTLQQYEKTADHMVRCRPPRYIDQGELLLLVPERVNVVVVDTIDGEAMGLYTILHDDLRLETVNRNRLRRHVHRTVLPDKPPF